MIETNGELISNPAEIANMFAKHMKEMAKCGKHIEIKEFEERLKDATSNGSAEDYNKDITDEVVEAIVMTRDNSPDLDG